MNKITRAKGLMIPKVTTGPISASTKVYSSPEGHPDIRVPFREIALSEGAGEPSFRVYDPSGPYTDANATIDVEKGLPRIRVAWVKERGGVEEYQGREVKPEDNGNVTATHLARDFPNKPRPLRATSTALAVSVPSPLVGEGQGGGASRTSEGGVPPTPNPSPQGGGEPAQRAPAGRHPVTQLEFARAGVVTKEMIYVAHRENLGRKASLARATEALADGESFGAAHPRAHHAGVRARRDRPRPRHHPGQHQPRRAGADDHRPQLPGEDQRQHRQLGRQLFRGGGGGEDGVGDPLGRRHRHGPLDGPQHPHHARVDPAQLPRPHRHGADLPGAGEVRRRPREAHLGALPRHPDRAVRAGRGLLHHPRRRAPPLRAAHRQSHHRHRLPRRLDHGQVVPGAP